jgi:hypothetical protein
VVSAALGDVCWSRGATVVLKSTVDTGHRPRRLRFQHKRCSMSSREDRGIIVNIGRKIGRDRPPIGIGAKWPPHPLAVTEMQPDEDKVDARGMITAAQDIGCFFLYILRTIWTRE